MMDPYHSPLHSHGYLLPELRAARRNLGVSRRRLAGNRGASNTSVWVLVKRLAGWRPHPEPRDLPGDATG